MNDTSDGGIGRGFRLYLDIVLLRKGPEDLPASKALLLLTIAANVLLSLVLGSLVPLPGGNRLLMTVAEAGFVLAWYWALLRLAGRPERFVQTTSAVFGFQTLLLPPLTAAAYYYVQQQRSEQVSLPFAIASLAIAIWALTVNSRIVRSATEWPPLAAVALVLLQALVGQVVILGLFPDIAARTATGGAAG